LRRTSFLVLVAAAVGSIWILISPASAGGVPDFAPSDEDERGPSNEPPVADEDEADPSDEVNGTTSLLIPSDGEDDGTPGTEPTDLEGDEN
jgi:hypothetical protein